MLGLKQSIRDALQAMDPHFHTDPRDFGEVKYRYCALKLELRVGIIPPLVAHFAVHDEQLLVIVKSIRSLPGYGFSVE